MSVEIVYSSCGEIFGNVDLCDVEHGCTYYSGTPVKINPSDLVNSYDVDSMIESMVERLYERVGEVACDAIEISEEKQSELLDVIKKFVGENVDVSCFAIDDIEEHIAE